MFQPHANRSSLPLPLWLGYVFFVIYGSLVPLQFQPRPFDQAWAAFQNIPYLQLGVGSRADWISNGVLYVPVGFLTAYLLAHSFQRLPRFITAVVAGAFAVALALGVEFSQLYFPPRTVSLNDLLAECIGSAIGLTLATTHAHWFHAMLGALTTQAHRLRALALQGYAVGYLVLTFFPYDFLISGPELADKINSPNWGWLLADTMPRLTLVGLQLVVETALVVPLGFMLAGWFRRSSAPRLQAVIAGLAFGLLIELAQFFMASGVSQGISVVTRGVGFFLGLILSQNAAAWSPRRVAAALVRYWPAMLLAYLLALLEINGFFTLQWLGTTQAIANLDETVFTPFYYHYYTTEARALFSLGVVAASYFPVALFSWARGRSPALAALLGLALCALVETGKLFLPGTHPDPTNLLIACVACWVSVQLLQLLSVAPAAVSAPAQNAGASPQAATAPTTHQRLPIWLVLTLVAVFAWGITFPVFPGVVLLVLAASGALVWQRPVLAFALIAAALPVFDLAPWSGRFFLDEFDALLAIVLAVGFARVPAVPRQRGPSGLLLGAGVALLLLSLVISTTRGLMPLAWPDANAFNNYHSSYNALRIAKGALWAYLAYRLFRRFALAGQHPSRPLGWGMVTGLALTVATVLWERATFSQLFDFSDGYRVTGPFSAAHTGGPYVDSFLALAVPFLLVFMFDKRHWLTRLALLPLALASTYALMLTFSRAGYLAYAVAVAASLFFLAAGPLGGKHRRLLLAGLATVMLAVAWPVYQSGFLQARLASAQDDLDLRAAQWQDSRAISDPGWDTTLFGMGVGRFPSTTYWRSTQQPRAGSYQLIQENGNTFLRLDAGDPIGLEQFAALKPNQAYTLKMDVRPSQSGTRFTVPICQKWLLTSAQCLWPTLDLGQKPGDWRSVQTSFTTPDLVGGSGLFARPIKLALTHSASQSTIDIDNVRLVSEQGAELLQNSGFSQGLDHWFFATAGALHSYWRVHSLFYGVLFDQGWLGLIALGAVILLALVRAAQKAWRGNPQATAAFAAISGLMAGGIFDNPLDAPRFLLLLLFLAWSVS